MPIINKVIIDNCTIQHIKIIQSDNVIINIDLTKDDKPEIEDELEEDE